ncbi:MAG: TolC family protein [Candidatus Rokubacteria bacterium]|nr:TolC family protein [Candidatus Rokubacteria bacterium]
MRRVLVVVMLMILGGVLGAEAQQTPPAAPAAQAPAATSRDVLTQRPISLDEAVAIALEFQPNIRARLSDYAAAKYRVDQALSPLLPQVTASVSTSRSESTSVTTSATTGATITSINAREFGDTLSAQVVLSQILFDFGKTAASTDAARKLSEVALEDVELQRQLITQTVKQAYTNINFALRLQRVAQQALQRAELNLRSARGFFDVGTRPKSDVTRAEVDVANARVDVIRARNAERLGRAALNVAMGVPADTATQVLDNLVYQPSALDRARLMEEAQRRRPEYRQAKLRAEAADAVVRRTSRDFLPDVTGAAAYGGTRTSFDEAWSLTLSLSWSIFDGGNRIARHREARANLDAAQARVRATELDIQRDVEQAQISVTEAEERIQAAQTAVLSAQENFRLAQGRFDAGVGTILELTDAQLALTQTQNTEAQALADFRIALSNLDRAVGLR